MSLARVPSWMVLLGGLALAVAFFLPFRVVEVEAGSVTARGAASFAGVAREAGGDQERRWAAVAMFLVPAMLLIALGLGLVRGRSGRMSGVLAALLGGGALALAIVANAHLDDFPAVGVVVRPGIALPVQLAGAGAAIAGGLGVLLRRAPRPEEPRGGVAS